MSEQFATRAQDSLNGAIGASDTSLIVNDASKFPTSGNFRILIDNELIKVGAVSGTTFSSLTRGQSPTSAGSHSNGATVTCVMTAEQITNAFVRLDTTPAQTVVSPILFPDGTVSAPSIGFGSEANTGFYKAGDDDVRFAADGADVLRMTDTNLEIFAAAVGGIKVNVNAGNSGFAMYQGGVVIGTLASSGGGGNPAFTAGAGKDFTFTADTGEVARFRSNGNATFQFGLGVGAAITGALDAQLASRIDGAGINVVAAFSNNQTAAANVGSELGWFGGGKRQAAIDGAWSGAATTDGYLTFNTRQSDSIVEVMRLNNKGQVSINQASPAASAILQIDSTVGALLIPRMTTTQKNALTPVNGMLLYDSTLNKFQGYENGAWANLI